MGKAVYLGVDGKARKVKKMYLGAGGKARKVKKGYIGVGGVARPFFTGGELSYYGKATSLYESAMSLASAYTTNHVLFAGGSTGNGSTSIVNAYSRSLTRTLPMPLPTGATSLSGASNGFAASRRALFAGGYENTSTNELSKVNSYDDSLTRSIFTNLSYGTFDMGSASEASGGRYAIFAGGYSGSMRNQVYCYDYNGALQMLTSLSLSRRYLCGASNREYAVFVGGYTSGSARATVDAYDYGLTKITSSSLGENTSQMSGGSVYHSSSAEHYMIFAGGNRGGTNNQIDSVYAYNESLTRTNLTALTHKVSSHACGYTKYDIVFSGGMGPISSSSITPTNVVNVYKDLVKQPDAHLPNRVRSHAGGGIGDYILFAGGYKNDSTYSSDVEVFSV